MNSVKYIAIAYTKMAFFCYFWIHHKGSWTTQNHSVQFCKDLRRTYIEEPQAYLHLHLYVYSKNIF